MPRRIGTLICLSVILTGVLLLAVVHIVCSSLEYEPIIETAITCLLIKGGLSIEYVIIFTYGSEMFPEEVRGTAVGLALTIAKMLGLLSTQLIADAEAVGTSSMVGPGITVILGEVAVLFLPETLAVKAKNKQADPEYSRAISAELK